MGIKSQDLVKPEDMDKILSNLNNDDINDEQALDIIVEGLFEGEDAKRLKIDKYEYPSYGFDSKINKDAIYVSFSVKIDNRPYMFSLYNDLNKDTIVIKQIMPYVMSDVYQMYSKEPFTSWTCKIPKSRKPAYPFETESKNIVNVCEFLFEQNKKLQKTIDRT